MAGIIPLGTEENNMVATTGRPRICGHGLVGMIGRARFGGHGLVGTTGRAREGALRPSRKSEWLLFFSDRETVVQESPSADLFRAE